MLLNYSNSGNNDFHHSCGEIRAERRVAVQQPGRLPGS